MLLRRIRLIALAAGIAVAVGLAVHAASAQPVPGGFVSLGTAGAAPTPPATAPPGVAVVAPPEPTATPDALPGGLRISLGSLFGRLNQDTAQTANGEYSLLQQLGGALRERINSFLTWVSSR